MNTMVNDAPLEDFTRFPPVSRALGDRLDALFPDKCPPLDASDRQVWYAIGQASVVRFLKRMLEEQES